MDMKKMEQLERKLKIFCDKTTLYAKQFDKTIAFVEGELKKKKLESKQKALLTKMKKLLKKAASPK